MLKERIIFSSRDHEILEPLTSGIKKAESRRGALKEGTVLYRYPSGSGSLEPGYFWCQRDKGSKKSITPFKARLTQDLNLAFMGRIEDLAMPCTQDVLPESFSKHGENILSVEMDNRGFALLKFLARQNYFTDVLNVDGVSDYQQILKYNGEYWGGLHEPGNSVDVDRILNTEDICHHSIFIFNMDFLEIEDR